MTVHVASARRSNGAGGVSPLIMRHRWQLILLAAILLAGCGPTKSEMFTRTHLVFSEKERYPWVEIVSITYSVDDGTVVMMRGVQPHPSIKMIVILKSGQREEISTRSKSLCHLGPGLIEKPNEAAQVWIDQIKERAPHVVFLSHLRGRYIYSNDTVDRNDTYELYPKPGFRKAVSQQGK